MSIQRPKVFWPLTITAGVNDKIDGTNGVMATPFTATLTPGIYYSVDSLLTEVVAALMAAAPDAWTATVNDLTGIVTIANGGTTFEILFSTGANAATSVRYLLGFVPADYDAAFVSVVAPYQHANGWYSPTPFKFDSRNHGEEPNTVITLAESGKIKVVREPELTFRIVDFHFLPAAKTFIADQVSPTYGHEAIQNWWRDGAGRFRLWPDATVEGTSADYAFDSSVLSDGFTPERQFNTRELYRVGPWKIRSYV